MAEANAVDVLICGAGAAGLTLAIDLARRGISFRLIDQLSEPFGGSRGKAVQPRTQEVFDDLGIIDAVMAVGGHYPAQRDYRSDGTVAEGQAYAVGTPSAAEPYPMTLLVPQFAVEAAMRDRLAELGFVPDYGHRLDSFEQDENGITARIDSFGKPSTIRCRYLVGADGGRSSVRRMLDVGFPGQTLGVRGIVADVVADGVDREAWHRFEGSGPGQQLALCPLPHTDLFQLQAAIPLEGEADLSQTGLQTLIDSRTGAYPVSIRSVSWASAFAMSARLADRYRAGRAFLVGDAAHVHPPTGGQGLNTSVQDAYNLGWKLAAVLNGAANGLLDTYEEERRPVAAAMLGLSTTLLERAKHGDVKRGREVHQFDIGYPDASLSRHMGDVGNMGDAIQAGSRTPDAILVDETGQPVRLFDLLRGSHFTLLTYATDTCRLSTPAASIELRRYAIGDSCKVRDPDDTFRTAYGLQRGEWALVRSDGYIGAIGRATDVCNLVQYLGQSGQ